MPTEVSPKRGAIFCIPGDVLGRALKAIGALPADAICLLPTRGADVLREVSPGVLAVRLKAYSNDLPGVAEGDVFPEHVACAGEFEDNPIVVTRE